MAMLAGVLAGGAALGAGGSASAAAVNVHPVPADGTVNGCAQSWNPGGPGTCISVVTGSKNTSNHTQWVGQITVAAPYGESTPGELQAWAGNGPTGVAWYQSTTGLSVTWNINQWIKTGSGICGEYTYPGSCDTSEACISITV